MNLDELTQKVNKHESAIIWLTALVEARHPAKCQHAEVALDPEGVGRCCFCREVVAPAPVDWNGGRKAVDALENAHGDEARVEGFDSAYAAVMDGACSQSHAYDLVTQCRADAAVITTLRARVAELDIIIIKQREEYSRDTGRIVDERDAALARVAELEKAQHEDAHANDMGFVEASAIIDQLRADLAAERERVKVLEGSADILRHLNDKALTERDAARAEVAALKTAIALTLDTLVNMQPHIPQSCHFRGVEFIDSHVDQAIEVLRTASYEVTP